MTDDSIISGIDFGAKPETLPATEKERKRFIFNFCGYAGAHPSIREWNRFNRSMNEGLDLGLDARTLGMLSIIDHALHEVPRFVDVPYVARGQVDSTTAHSKQSMNNGQRVFEEAFANRKASPEAQQFRRLCLLGLWMHDYGETVFELTTASLMQSLGKADREEIKEAKDVIEREIVLFNFAVAEAGLDAGQPDLLQQKLRQIRTHAIHGSASLQGRERVMERIRLIREGIGVAYRELAAANILVSAEPGAHAKELIAVYDALENEGAHPAGERNFLHAYGKTVESVEGQRYLQKNAKEPPHMPLYKALSNHDHPSPLPFHAMPPTEVIENYRRCERRLPALFEPMAHIPSLLGKPSFTLGSAEKDVLARSCAAFTYHSLARPYLPREGDDVATVSAPVDRAPHLPPTERKPRRMMGALELGYCYRAAALAVQKGNYTPQKGSIIALEDTPVLARTIDLLMQRMAQAAPSTLQQR